MTLREAIAFVDKISEHYESKARGFFAVVLDAAREFELQPDRGAMVDPQLSARDLAVLVREMRRHQRIFLFGAATGLPNEKWRLEAAVDKACSQILGDPQPAKGT